MNGHPKAPHAHAVRLTAKGIEWADDLATRRQNGAKQYRPNGGYASKPNFQLTSHMLGARGEKVVAEFMRWRADGDVGTFSKGSDLNSGIEVRTRWSSWQDLLIRPKDLELKPDVPFIHVTGAYEEKRKDELEIPSVFCIWGWLTPGEAAAGFELQSFRTSGPTWFIKAQDLRPLNELASKSYTQDKINSDAEVADL